MAEAPAQPPRNRSTAAPAASARARDEAPAPDDRDDAATPDWNRLSEEERAVLLKVSEILQRIQFGTVVLSVQDGKVVQIEMAEKFRLR
jgi:hypothetical protein